MALDLSPERGLLFRKRHGVEKLTPARALMAEMIRRSEVLGRPGRLCGSRC